MKIKRLYLPVIFCFILIPFCSAQKSKTELSMEKAGFENIREKDPNIKVSLMYGRPDNFTGKLLYTDLHQAYLHPKALAALIKAQKILKKYNTDFSLVVFDAARPMSIQQRMWDAVKGTSKSPYVSNPSHGGGLHNYGLAVDISIANEKGDTIDMGTKVDYLGKRAHIDNEALMVKKGWMSNKARENRLLLRKVMREAGFHALRSEWWHFNYCSRATAKAHYKVIH